MKNLVDREARELINTALDRNVVVEAAAGTGKTTALVERIVRVLEEGRAEIGRIVAVTFTEQAAGELKLRLRSRLEQARAQAGKRSERRGNVDRALAHLEEAHVNTIHGFCADLLRERPVDARIDPAFEAASEAEAERLYGESFRLWLEQKLEDPPEGVRRSLRRPSPDGPVERLRTAGWALAAWRDYRAPWRREPFDREAQIDALI